MKITKSKSIFILIGTFLILASGSCTPTGTAAINPVVITQVVVTNVIVVTQNAPIPKEVDSTPTLVPSPTITNTPTLEITPTLKAKSASTGVNEIFVTIISVAANGRTGPGTVYPIVLYYRNGETVRAIGRNHEATWLVVEGASHKPRVWVKASLVKATSKISNLPEIDTPPTPTPAPDITFIPKGKKK